MTVSGELVEPRLSDESRPSTGSGLTANRLILAIRWGSVKQRGTNDPEPLFSRIAGHKKAPALHRAGGTKENMNV